MFHSLAVQCSIKQSRLLKGRLRGVAVAGLSGVVLWSGVIASAATDKQRETTVYRDQWYNTSNNALPRNAPRNWDFRGDRDFGKSVPRVNDYRGVSGARLNAWGQVYEIEGTNMWAPNTRVQIRNLNLWELVVYNGQWEWYLTQKADGWGNSSQNVMPINGAAFNNDYSNQVGVGDGSLAADDNRNSAGHPRVRVGRMAWKRWNGSRWVTDRSGYGNTNYHFFPNDRRRKINGNDGVFVTCQARLVNMSSSQYDDRAQSKYTMSVGADHWNEDYSYKGDSSIGRFKQVRNNWQTFRTINLNKADIERWTPMYD